MGRIFILEFGHLSAYELSYGDLKDTQWSKMFYSSVYIWLKTDRRGYELVICTKRIDSL